MSEPAENVSTESRRPTLLLALGAAVGIVLAATGLVGVGHGAGPLLPPDAIARVNGEIIRTEDYERTLAGVASDRRDPVDDAQRKHVLDRLIEEELLVQRGLELGLARHDRKVRADLTGAMISSIIAESQDAQPTDAELQAFYDRHRDFFTRPGRVRVRQILCRSATPEQAATALAHAKQAVQRLRAGESFEAVRAALGDQQLSPLPDTLLPPEKLVDYLGPTALRTVLSLGVGEVSEPVRSGVGFHVLQVVERQADVTPAFADVKPQVVAEYRRRAGDRALRSYLDDLRAQAQVIVTPTLP